MVKQFTIPCQFGQEMSPVTLYIGHPEATHHPINFQSNWLSSAKGGTVPQDLMDTLQRLHDLAEENGADFEELCYYALISATQHGTGNGVSKDDINKYADEFVKTEGQCAQDQQPQQQETQNNNQAESNNNIETEAESIKKNNNQNNSKQESTEDKILQDVVQNTYTKDDEDKVEGMFAKLGEMFSKENKTDTSTKTLPTINTTTSFSSSTQSNTATNKSDAVAVYTAEDEDLLLMDDLDPILDDNDDTSVVSDYSETNTSNDIKEAEPVDNSNGTYSDDDADLL